VVDSDGEQCYDATKEVKMPLLKPAWASDYLLRRFFPRILNIRAISRRFVRHF